MYTFEDGDFCFTVYAYIPEGVDALDKIMPAMTIIKH